MLTLFPTAQTGESKVYNFIPYDTEKLFKKNKKTMQSDWPYHNKKVEYRVGSHGYRCPEFEDIDWSRSVVLFGCSMTYGIGVDEEETIGFHLSKIIDKPVINLGLGGTSMLFSAVNQMRLYEAGIKPYAVVNIWTSTDRMCEFKDNGNVVHYLPSGRENLWRKNFVATDAMHQLTLHKFYAGAVKNLWPKSFELSLFEKTSKLLQIPYIERIDYARDLMHQGTKTNRLIAETIVEGLK